MIPRWALVVTLVVLTLAAVVALRRLVALPPPNGPGEPHPTPPGQEPRALYPDQEIVDEPPDGGHPLPYPGGVF